MKVLDRKLLRDLWGAKGQVIAVTAVITCGIAAFITVLSAYRNLTLSRDAYYRKYRFHDFSVQLEKAPLAAVFKVEELPGGRAARGRIVKDVNLDIPGQKEPRIGRIISLPENPTAVIDGVHLASGRFFTREAPDECVVSDKFLHTNGLRLGNRITVTINGRKQSLKIVGTGLSPEYVYAIRNAAEIIPNPKKFAVIWVGQAFAEMAFDLQGACTEIVGEVQDPARLEVLLDRARKLLKPYGVYAATRRTEQISHQILADEIRGLGNSARITPPIYLGVAAMILLVLLSRMVQRERTQIGLLKAYGYTSWAIAAHYLKFALLVGLAGCVLGFGLGQWLGRGMMRIYVQFYSFPVLRYQFYPDMFLWALGVSVLFSAAGALAAVVAVVRIDPAAAMRDVPPRPAHRVIWERIGPLWRSLDFTGKIIARNIARYPVRSALTVVSVMLATGLLLIGYFNIDAVEYMIDHQFRQVQREDVRVTFFQERGRSALHEAERFPHVQRVEPVLMYPFEVRKGWRHKDLLITGLPPGARLYHLMDTDGSPILLDRGGLTITDYTARELGLEPGDIVHVKPLMGKVARERRVRVSRIVQQYIGMSAYMSLEGLSNLLGETEALNAVLLRVEPGRTGELNASLKDLPAVATVEIKEDQLRSFQETFAQSMGIMTTIVTVFAGVIAMAVIYNSTMIGITERRRELASLRVLGFTPQEVGRIVFHENVLLSLAGMVLGLPFGMAVCRLIIRAYSTEMYRIPFHIRDRTYAVSALTIIGFVLLTNWFSRRKIAALDMVEALKLRE